MREAVNEKSITGLMFYYHFVCKRKLWYFYHEIQMEQNSENVQIGKLIDETAYGREKKHINIDDVINVDFLKDKNCIHEVKKSKKIEEASVWQIKYYLYYLKQRGLGDLVGQIDYPMLKQTLEVRLTKEDEKCIEETLQEIKDIVKEQLPPEYSKKKICKTCAYYDLCGI